MNIGNRMPFLQIQNKSENSQVNKMKNKASDNNCKILIIIKVLTHPDEKQSLGNAKFMSHNNPNNLKKEENKIPAEIVSEERFADEEHNKCVVKALQKAIDENEEVCSILIKLSN